MNISERAMLVTLSISQWTGSVKDKSVENKVNDIYSAVNAGKFSKSLVDKDALAAISTAAGKARSYFNSVTLPWNDNGTRLLPADRYGEFTSKMKELKEAFNEEAAKFIENYQTHIDRAKDRLGELFSESAYPSMDTIGNKFNIRWHIMPVSTSDDFRVQLTQSEVDTIKKEIHKSTEEAVVKTVEYLLETIKDMVSKIATKMDDGTIFRNSLFGNLQELSENLPSLNITNDQRINSLVYSIKELCSCSPEDVRNDFKVREAVSAQANDILERMKGYGNV